MVVAIITASFSVATEAVDFLDAKEAVGSSVAVADVLSKAVVTAMATAIRTDALCPNVVVQTVQVEHAEIQAAQMDTAHPSHQFHVRRKRPVCVQNIAP